MTIREAKALALETLSKTSPSAELDVNCLLSHVTGLDKTALLFKREQELDAARQESFFEHVKARSTGLPVAYITGHKEFFGYDFLVSPQVLIPKPDTELLVEQGIEFLRQKHSALKAKSKNTNQLLSICDMCTGSGCVGISILRACADEHIFEPAFTPSVTFVDISPSALEIARKNAERVLGKNWPGKTNFVRSNLFHCVNGSFDLIVSNPPYIPSSQAKSLLLDGRSEPILALDGDVDINGNPTGADDGLGIMRNLIPQACTHLVPSGLLAVEAGEYNARMTEQLFTQSGLKSTQILRDLAGDLRDITGVK